MYYLRTFALSALAFTASANAAERCRESTSCYSTICADNVNSCGQTYGGCYPACSGYTTPTFSDPGCPSTTASRSTASCDNTICVDYINSCGQWYGGCFPDVRTVAAIVTLLETYLHLASHARSHPIEADREFESSVTY